MCCNLSRRTLTGRNGSIYSKIYCPIAPFSMSRREGATEMATIFLANPAGALSLEVLKTFRALKSLPDDFYVWHHLAKWEMEAPDFLVRTAQNQAILIKVSLANSQAARPAAQLLLMETKQPPLGAAEEAVLHEFLSGVKLYFRATSPSQIRAVVLFPNIEAKRLKRGPQNYQFGHPVVGSG